MKIKIESDVFDIAKRVKDIDEDYYILFDTSKNVYELHHKNQPNTYCFSYEFQNLDSRFIDKVYATNVNNIVNIVEDIDKNNDKIVQSENEKIKNTTDFMLREIYSFANNSSKELDDAKAFKSVWR